ncbi:hypothetical protein ACFV6B_40345 [Streptomyces microflavus]|uniref:hypothetical protein n=1 Tax=Streptomyces microflavus TaxID=1919 RepID=UPI00366565B0
MIDSASSGYEKPHAQALRLARAAAGPAHRLVTPMAASTASGSAPASQVSGPRIRP